MSGDAPSALTALVRGQRMFGLRLATKHSQESAYLRRVEVDAPFLCAATLHSARIPHGRQDRQEGE